jgi:hypothetical protein
MKPRTERSHDRKFGQLVALGALVDGPRTGTVAAICVGRWVVATQRLLDGLVS